MASTEKRSINLSKLTLEYLVPKIDLLGTTQLSIDMVPSVEELNYLGRENLDAMKLNLRRKERELHTASMKVGLALGFASIEPEAWRTYRPLDTITEAEKAEAWKAFQEGFNSNPQTAVLTNDNEFLEYLESRLAAISSTDKTAQDAQSYTYRCDCTPSDTVLPACRFGTYIAAWCRNESTERYNSCEDDSCDDCLRCASANHCEKSCVFTKADQAMFDRCKKFLYGLRGRLAVSQDAIATYIRRIRAAANGARSKPLFSIWRNPNWITLGGTVFVVSDMLSPKFALGQVVKLENPYCPEASVKVEQNDPAPYSFYTEEMMKPSEYNYLCDHGEYRELWLTFSYRPMIDDTSVQRVREAFRRNGYTPVF